MKKQATYLLKVFSSKPSLISPLYFSSSTSFYKYNSHNRYFSNLYSDKLKELRQSIKQSTEDTIKEKQEGKNTEQKENKSEQEENQRTRLFNMNNRGRVDPYRADIIYSMDLDSVLQVFRSSLQDQSLKPGYDFYNACLDRINQIITERNANLDKSQIVTILRDLSYYRPKQEEDTIKMKKKQGIMTELEMQQDILSKRHIDLIGQQKQKFISVPEHMFNFVYQNLSKGILQDLFTNKEEKQQSKLNITLYDVMANYIELYENLSVRVIDMSNEGYFDSKDALDMLVSYSIAEEGTNTLYIRLIEQLLRRKEEYNMVEVEMLLNYFPHQIWRSEDALTQLMDAFYYPLIKKVNDNLTKLQKRQFLSIFQGITVTGQKIVSKEMLNKFLNSFAQRIKEKPSDQNEQFTVSDVLIFYEIFIQYLRLTPDLSENVDSQALIDFTNETIIEPYIPHLSFHQLSGIYWTNHNLKINWKEKTVALLEERISKLLREELLLQKQMDKGLKGDEKEGLQSMNIYDLEVIEHYYQVDQSLLEVSKRKKEILNLIRQVKNWDKPEKERKWFHF